MDIEDIFQTKDITNKIGIRKFIHQFARGDNWHNLDFKSANLGYGFIHYALIRALQSARILVIGSRYGFIPAICALACKDNGFGRVDFVDANYDQNNPQHPDNWGGVGYWTTTQSLSAFKRFGLEKHISLFVMTSEIFHKNNSHQKWQIIHLDGDHSYKGVTKDFSYFWPQLTRGGFISLHDIYTKNVGRTDYGVYKFWIELKKQHGYTMIEFPGKFGLGLIQKTQ